MREVDYLEFSRLLSHEERLVRDAVREFVDSEVRPHISRWWTEGAFPSHLVTTMGELGLLGANLPPEYGCAGLGEVAYGLAMRELERGDSALRSFASVQGALVMFPIASYGSEEQKKLLPELASGRVVGCFGLTEPEGGSDPGSTRTRARKRGNTWILNGRKAWITNGTLAHIALVWARDEEGEFRGFLVPTDTPGFEAREVKGKFSMRASVTSELYLDEVALPETAALPGAVGLKAALSCLTQARYGIAWGVLGAAEDCYLEALSFASTRVTFGAPIASRQLVQEKLVRMLAGITRSQLLAYHLGRLKEEGRLRHAQVSLAKRENVRTALEVARTAREILGAAGITVEHATIRHMLNFESVDTYEGTWDIHTLTIGRDLTGHDALR